MPELSPRELSEIPETSRLEEETKDLVLEEGVKSEADLERIIGKVFSEVCGENGRTEFFRYAVPAVKKIYGNNYRKAAIRLLEIIEQGSERTPNEIGEFFKDAVSKAELEFSEMDKDQMVEGIVSTINDLIREQEEQFGRKGVVAAIIFGSYANKNFRLSSELDIVYVTGSREEGQYIPEDEKYVNFAEAFDFSLNKRIRPATQPGWYKRVSMEDLTELRSMAEEEPAVGGSYVTVTPYAEVREKIEATLQKKRA